jgi:hypothetical protein
MSYLLFIPLQHGYANASQYHVKPMWPVLFELSEATKSLVPPDAISRLQCLPFTVYPVGDALS